MAPYNWETMKRAAERLQGQTETLVRSSAFCNCIKRDTTATYTSQVRRLLKWHQVLKENPTREGRFPSVMRFDEPKDIDRLSSEELFLRAGSEITELDYYAFLLAHAGFERIPFHTLRCALRHAQVVAGSPTWAGDEAAIAAEKSAMRTGEVIRARRPTGTLNGQMIWALMQRAKAISTDLHDAVVVQMGACLRYNELSNIRARHVVKQGIIIVDAKRDRVNNSTNGIAGSVKTVEGWAEGKAALGVLRTRAAAAKSPEDLLFPRSAFDHKGYNEFLRRSAEHLRWPSELCFDGSHVLRHAGVRRAVEGLLASNKTLSEVSKTLHMSIRMIVHYALTNEERIRKVNIPRFLTHLPEFQRLLPSLLSAPLEEEEEEGEQVGYARQPIPPRMQSPVVSTAAPRSVDSSGASKRPREDDHEEFIVRSSRGSGQGTVTPRLSHLELPSARARRAAQREQVAQDIRQERWGW